MWRSHTVRSLTVHSHTVRSHTVARTLSLHPTLTFVLVSVRVRSRSCCQREGECPCQSLSALLWYSSHNSRRAACAQLDASHRRRQTFSERVRAVSNGGNHSGAAWVSESNTRCASYKRQVVLSKLTRKTDKRGANPRQRNRHKCKRISTTLSLLLLLCVVSGAKLVLHNIWANCKAIKKKEKKRKQQKTENK